MFRLLPLVTVLSLMTVIRSGGEYIQIKQRCVDTEVTTDSANTIQENTKATPTNPGPITKDTQAASTRNPWLGDLALGEEKNDQVYATLPVDSTETSDHYGPVHPAKSPDPDTETPIAERTTSDSSVEKTTSINAETGRVEVTFTTTDRETTRDSVPVRTSTMATKMKICGAFSCIGTACYRHMNATEICQEGMSYCELWRSVTQVTWNQYASVWTAGCAHRCGPREPCSPFSGYRCQQECCEARADSCLKLDGSVGVATGSRPCPPLMLVLMCVMTSQLFGQFLS